MLKITLSLFVSFLFCYLNGFAQQHIDSQQKTIATKGYYSIGNETEKVNSKSLDIKYGNPPKVAKGYYSIGNHNEKLPKPITVVVTTTPKPVANKGYYNIDADSLQYKKPD